MKTPWGSVTSSFSVPSHITVPNPEYGPYITYNQRRALQSMKKEQVFLKQLEYDLKKANQLVEWQEIDADVYTPWVESYETSLKRVKRIKYYYALQQKKVDRLQKLVQ